MNSASTIALKYSVIFCVIQIRTHVSEQSTCSLVEAALATPMKMERIAKVRRLVTTGAGVFGVTMGAAHGNEGGFKGVSVYCPNDIV